MDRQTLRETNHFGIALYGFAEATCTTSDVYSWALKWFERLGCRPGKCNSDLGGKLDDRYKLFRTADRKLKESGFASVTYWKIVAIPDQLAEEKHGEYYGIDMGVSYSSGVSKYLVFHIREALIHNRKNDLFELAKQACELLQPKYGIGYKRQFQGKPSLYGIGMRGGSADPIDANLDSWRMFRDHEMFAILRGVYSWNLLTATQLNLRVNGFRLRDWILLQNDRGRISPLTNQVALWEVPDERILAVREELWKAGLVLDEKRDVEARMDQYDVDADTVIKSLKAGTPLVHRPPSNGISEEEMLGRLLLAFDESDAQVLRVEKPGELRELSDTEKERAKAKGKSKTANSRKSDKK